MANSFLKSNRVLILVVVVIAAGAFLGWKYLQSRKYAVPNGIASGNGRIEAKLVDATAKEPLRVKDILVDEGDLVQPGQVLVHLDTVTLDAQLAEAKANVAAAQEQLAVVNAGISKRKSEVALAKIELDRSQKMLADRASSQREVDVRQTTVETTTATLAEERARLQTALQQVAVAEANVATVQSRINDATLVSPVLGRVLYRLAEPGEVLGPGGKALTLVNLNDVYMEIFLPAGEAAPLKVGSEGRLTVDNQPGRSAPAFVSFVSPEGAVHAQAGGDEERAREAHVPGQAAGPEVARPELHREHQDRRARRGLRQGEPERGVARMAREGARDRAHGPGARRRGAEG
jgi:HlyD family secretion protein